VQTFLPYPDFQESARCLDNRRLGKQRVEGFQIMRVLIGLSTGWQNHPAVRMWRGYVGSLANYTVVCCDEWIRRGYRDSIRFQVECLITPYEKYALPYWLGNPEFHTSHRSNLLRKDPVFYGRYGWTEPSDLPYVWPKEKQKWV
jgi:hypothetical protein